MGIIGNIKNANGVTLFKMYESHANARARAFRVHYHTEAELSLILSGSGTYNCAGRLYPISAGDIFFYKSSVPHCITDIADGGMSILNIHISPIYFQMIKSEADAPHFGRSFLKRTLPSAKLNEVLSADEAERMRALILSLKTELALGAEAFGLMAESCLAMMLIIIARKAEPLREKVEKDGTEAVFRALEFIDRHYTEPISLACVAERVNLEKTYFASLFKRTVGTNPWEYVLIKRIETAVELLRSCDSTVLEIASQTGFNSTASFNKIFKKYTGTTPKELRKFSTGGTYAKNKQVRADSSVPDGADLSALT